MFIIRDKPPGFEEVVGHVVQSVIPIAVGTRQKDNQPNIVGTGFALEYAEYFSTCAHVAEVHEQLLALSQRELSEKGLRDATLRIALRQEDGAFVWREVEEKTWFRVIHPQDDVCVYRCIGNAVPPLLLSKSDAWLLGAEVGILGFPLGNALQGNRLRPYVVKTIISGGLEWASANGNLVPRLALGASIAGGFSGGPVFSAATGEVVGMLSSTMLEPRKDWDWPAGVSLAVAPGAIREALEACARDTIRGIKQALQANLPGPNLGG